MTGLSSSIDRVGGKRFAFLNSRLASIRSSVAAWAPIPLRLIVGYGFLEHGYAKLARGPEAFAAILHAMNVPAPHFAAWLTILTELIGGLAVLLGAFIPLVSLPMAAVLAVAMLTVHLPYGFSSIKLLSVVSGRAQFGPPGYELDLLYLACLAALVIGGSGPLSLNAYTWRRFKDSSSKRFD
jgi:putative oxidoreductase